MTHLGETGKINSGTRLQQLSHVSDASLGLELEPTKSKNEYKLGIDYFIKDWEKEYQHPSVSLESSGELMQFLLRSHSTHSRE